MPQQRRSVSTFASTRWVRRPLEAETTFGERLRLATPRLENLERIEPEV